MRAPHQPASWFRPVMPPKPVAPPQRPDLSSIPEFNTNDEMENLSRQNFILNTLNSWRRDPCYDFEDIFTCPRAAELQQLLNLAKTAMWAHKATWDAYDDDLRDWNHEEALQYVAQWPWVWADLVLSGEVQS